MNTFSRRTFGAICGALILLASIPVDAQVSEDQTLSFSYPGSTIEAPFTSCFDYYTYGSVEAEPSVALSTVSPGAVLPYTVVLTNSNTHPIVDAQIYIKVMRENGTEKSAAGPDIVDQFVAEKGISLKAGEVKKFELLWQVPQRVARGNYSIAPYIQGAERFNLQGLSFTNDITGPLAQFAIDAESPDAVRFDTENLVLNGQQFNVIGIPPDIGPDEEIFFSAPLRNDTDVPVQGTITWRLYSWDGLRRENVLRELSQNIKIHPGDTVEGVFKALDDRSPILYLEGVSDVGGHRSVVSARFTRIGAESARFNDVGISSYPATKDSVAYVCVQELLTDIADPDPRSDGKLTLTVQDEAGVAVATREYEGKMPFALSALPLPLTDLTRELKDFTITATLSLEDRTIDSVSASYTCADLGEVCERPIANTSTEDSRPFTYIWYFVPLGVFVLIALVYVMRKRMYGSSPDISNI